MGLNKLEELNKDKFEKWNDIYEMQHKTYVSCREQLSNLADMKMKEQINDDLYNEKRTKLITQIESLESAIKKTQEQAKEWDEKINRGFDFAVRAKECFEKGDLKTKRDILRTLGSNFLLKDGKLTLEPRSWLIEIKENYPPIEEKYFALELNKTPQNLLTNEKREAFTSLCNTWLGR